MRLYKRGPVWWCSWTEGGSTIKRSTRCSSRDAAAIVAQRWERERADPAHAAAEKALFTEESRIFLAGVKARPKVPDGTVNMYECKVGHLNRLMPARMADLDAKAVDAYFLARREEGADPEGSTLYKEWIALRGVLRTAARRGHWSGEIDILRPEWVTQSSKPKERRLTWPELRALLDQAPPHLADVVRYAVATGGRRVELIRAQEGDANPKTNAMLLRGSKTAGAWKMIPVPPIFRELLPARAWGDKPNGKLLLPDCPADLRCLNRACRSAKIARVTYNDLRRTFTSLLLDVGVTNTVAAQLTRHKSTAMIDKHYGKVDDGALSALVERQAAVPPVSHGGQKQASHTEATDTKTALLVGQDRLELSANGLRGLWSALESSKETKKSAPAVPPVSHRLPYEKPRLLRLVALPPDVARRVVGGG